MKAKFAGFPGKKRGSVWPVAGKSFVSRRCSKFHALIFEHLGSLRVVAAPRAAGDGQYLESPAPASSYPRVDVAARKCSLDFSCAPKHLDADWRYSFTFISHRAQDLWYGISARLANRDIGVIRKFTVEAPSVADVDSSMILFLLKHWFETLPDKAVARTEVSVARGSHRRSILPKGPDLLCWPSVLCDWIPVTKGGTKRGFFV